MRRSDFAIPNYAQVCTFQQMTILHSFAQLCNVQTLSSRVDLPPAPAPNAHPTGAGAGPGLHAAAADDVVDVGEPRGGGHHLPAACLRRRLQKRLGSAARSEGINQERSTIEFICDFET